MAFQRASRLRCADFFRRAWSLEKRFSMGLRSGEYGGRYRQRAPVAAMASCTPATLWLGKLSAMTMSPGCSVGQRNVCPYLRNASPSRGPSRTIGAVMACTRKPAMKGVVCPCPCGTDALPRGPWGARPRARVILGLVPVSSRKTSFSTSSVGWLACHSARAVRTSSRACSLARRVFCTRQLPLVQLRPQRRRVDHDPVRCQCFVQLDQGHIGVLVDPRPDLRLHVRHAGTTLPAQLQPRACATSLIPSLDVVYPSRAHVQTPRHRRGTFATLQPVQHSITYVLGIRRHTCPSLQKRNVSQTSSTIK